MWPLSQVLHCVLECESSGRQSYMNEHGSVPSKPYLPSQEGQIWTLQSLSSLVQGKQENSTSTHKYM